MDENKRYYAISIPTNQSFLNQWHQWVVWKVSSKFKRNQERIADSVQNVCLRLLSKDFIGRWFFKHLKNELVTRFEAERMLGGLSILHRSQLVPVCGKRRSNLVEIKQTFGDVDDKSTRSKNISKSSKVKKDREIITGYEFYGENKPGIDFDTSLYRISDVLNFANFDIERYYYSIQGHTIDSTKVLKLLGYPSDKFTSLQSLYRQGRLLPSEYTEHECSGHEKCPECESGRRYLQSRGVSLAHDWSRPEVAEAVRNLRWNDNQLKPFLRNWRQQNMITTTPRFIMRQTKHDIGAGLKKYANIIIDNELVNDFKRIRRSDDVDSMVFNHGLSPEFSDTESSELVFNEDDNTVERVLLDTSSFGDFNKFEIRHDLNRMLTSAKLLDSEIEAITDIYNNEIHADSEFESDSTRKGSQKTSYVRKSAIRKIRAHAERESASPINELVVNVAKVHGCSVSEILGDISIGSCVVARSDLFSALFDMGMKINQISNSLGFPEDRIVAGINRQGIRESRLGL